MGKIEIKKGMKFHSTVETVSQLEVVLSGSIRISNSYHSITVSNGAIIGIAETPGTAYSYTYEAIDDTTLYVYPFHTAQDIEKVILSNPKISNVLASAAIRSFLDIYNSYQSICKDAAGLYRFIKDSYDEYLSLCKRFSVPVQSLHNLEELEAFFVEDELPGWIVSYYSSLRAMSSDLKKEFYLSSPQLGLGIILQSVERIQTMISISNQADEYLYELTSYIISQDQGDFFDLYSNLVFHASRNPFNDTTPIEAAVSKLIIYLQGSKFLDPELLNDRVLEYRQKLHDIDDMILSEANEESPVEKDTCDSLEHSLNTILDYASYPDNEREEFIEFLEKYKAMDDKNSIDDDARKLRRSLTDHFYRIYEAAFTNSLFDEKVPTVLKMFFCFGYMDEALAGLSNAIELHQIASTMKPDPSGNVLTIYEWLTMISRGEVEPSKNEFDLDYPAYLREQRSQGNISIEDEKRLLTDRSQKLHFEIQNLFKTGNRITFGRITTFCPIFSEHNILRPLNSMFASPAVIHEVLDQIRSIDFSCFYRETIYSNQQIGITKEYIQLEVLPHIILMPNIGIRGSLWQEIAGPRRDTPARMMLSVFPTENLFDLLTRMSGEFRWELCKRIQGVHWNDITDRSLTSEYCDYIQFYRKNHELSPEAKDKIKLNLQKAKNNYREVFVMDYVTWIKYEGNGSPRLNRYVRNILFTYCPFPVKLRTDLLVNPLYQDLIERYKIRMSQKKHMLDVLYQKLQNSGTEIPQEISRQRDFLDL